MIVPDNLIALPPSMEVAVAYAALWLKFHIREYEHQSRLIPYQ